MDGATQAVCDADRLAQDSVVELAVEVAAVSTTKCHNRIDRNVKSRYTSTEVVPGRVPRPVRRGHIFPTELVMTIEWRSQRI